MKYILLLLTLYGLSAHAQSASDTVYFDQYWNKCTRDSFTFYRTFKTQNAFYLITDHFKNGTTQMVGTYTSLDPEIKNGIFTYYSPSGYKIEEAEFYNNKRHGKDKFYDDTIGRLKSAIEYRNGKKNGLSYWYYKNGNITTQLYQDDKFISTRTDAKKKSDDDDTGPLRVESTGIKIKNLLTDIVKRKFLYVPDSLKHRVYMVTVSFEVDTAGTIINVVPPDCHNKWFGNVVLESVKELPRIVSDSGTLSDLYTGGHTFRVLFPDIRVTETTKPKTGSISNSEAMLKMFNSMSRNRTSSTDTGNFFTNSFFGLTSNGQRPSLSGTLKKNYKLLPDSLKNIAGDVKVSYDLDSMAVAKNVSVERSDNAQLNSVVLSTVKEVYDSSHSNANFKKTAQCSLKVSFPGLMTTESLAYSDGTSTSNVEFINANASERSNSTTNDASNVFKSISDSLTRWQTYSKTFSPNYSSLNSSTILNTYFKGSYEQTKMASDNTSAGQVIVKFEVNEKGKPSHIELIWGKNEKLNNFVIKMVKKYKDWTPVVRGGKAVPSIFRLSIHFPDVKVVSNSSPK